MAALAGNLTALLSFKVKPRHDDYTDQVSRICVVKILIVSSLVMGIDWVNDKVTCLSPRQTITSYSIPDSYIESACWIKGFYVYSDLPLSACSYYGIPTLLKEDGKSRNSQNSLCSTVNRLETKKNENCIPHSKRYLNQYQWMPLCVATMSLLFYMPYIIYRVVNTDMISLRANLKDKVESLPKYTSSIVERCLKPLSTPYTELAETYTKHDMDELRTIANKHQNVYQTDNNVGMIKQLIASLIKKRIQKLTKTFLTLSLVDMATRVKLRDATEAEKYLLEMIEDGSIHASIDQQVGIVSFKNGPNKYSTTNMLRKVDDEMSKCMELNEQLLIMDGDLQTNSQYVQKAMSMAQFEDGTRADEIIG